MEGTTRPADPPGDENNFAPSLETYVQSVEVIQKFCTFITQHELEIANPSPGGAAAHGALQSTTPTFTTCGDAAEFYSRRPPNEAINAGHMVETSDENIWALESSLDDTEYSKSAVHAKCDHYFCMSSFTDKQYAGLGYTQGLRRKCAEAWAVQDFLQSLNSESTEHILSESRSKQDSIPDPINDREAESHAYKAEWHVARTAEIKALNDKDVLRDATSAELTKIRSSRITVLGTRFVYKTKLKADGSVERYKARLVVQGFNQRLGLHYQADNVESPTVHAPTFKSLVAMATQLNLAIVQIHGCKPSSQGAQSDQGRRVLGQR